MNSSIITISEFSEKDFCLDHCIHMLNKISSSAVSSNTNNITLPIYQQDNTNLCVFESVALLKCKQDNVNNLNPLFLYHLSQHSQKGATLRNVLVTLYTHGIASTNTYKCTNTSDINNHQITTEIIKEAKLHSIKGWGRIYSPETVLDALKINKQQDNHMFGSFPLILPIYSIDPEFWKPPVVWNQPIIYHCVSIVDYCEKKQAFKLQNSWGSLWGEQGCTWFPLSDWYIYVIECGFATNSNELSNIIKDYIHKNHLQTLESGNGNLDIEKPKLLKHLINTIYKAPQNLFSFFYKPLVPQHKWTKKKRVQ